VDDNDRKAEVEAMDNIVAGMVVRDSLLLLAVNRGKDIRRMATAAVVVVVVVVVVAAAAMVVVARSMEVVAEIPMAAPVVLV
jgi:hypothetical protein